MKFSIPYTGVIEMPLDCIESVGEMYFVYKNQEDAIRKYQNHNGKYRMLLVIQSDCPIKELEEVQEALEYNCSFVFELFDKDMMQKCQNLKSIISSHSCSTWHEAYSLSNIGFTEVHLVPSLMMRVNDIKRIKDDTGLKVRAAIDYAQTDCPLDDKTPKSFWVRPEALHYYETALDTAELSRVEALPYYDKRESPKNLDNLIHNLPPFTANENYRDIHDYTRLNCGMKCKSGAQCSICR